MRARCRCALVTYLKPLVPNATVTSDPAGFFISGGGTTGPCLFVAVDPATVAGGLLVGDQINFTVDFVLRSSGTRFAGAVSNVTISSRGNPVTGLAGNVTAVDFQVAANLDTWESRLVSFNAAVIAEPVGAGGGYKSVNITTTGTPSAGSNFRLRLPVALMDSQGLGPNCTASVTAGPMWRFLAQAQPSVFNASELNGTTCPAPTLVSATATSSTGVTLLFSRDILASTVVPANFTIGGSSTLAVSAATQPTPRSVSLTTAAQTASAVYSVTVSLSVLDVRNTPVASGVGAFTGFVASACHVVINELRTQGQTAADEFIELFNPCTAGATIDGRLVYRSATGTSDTLLKDFAATPLSIAAGGYLLIANSTGYVGLATPDATHTSGLAAPGGGVALLSASLTVIDSVGYGTATNAYVEGAAAAAPLTTQSLIRTNGVDTNNNATNFSLTTTITPRALNQ